MFITEDQLNKYLTISDAANMDSDVKELTERSIELIRKFYNDIHEQINSQTNPDFLAATMKEMVICLDLQLSLEYYKHIKNPDFNQKSKFDYHDIMVAFISILGLNEVLRTLIKQHELGLQYITVLIFSIQRDIKRYSCPETSGKNQLIHQLYHTIFIPRLNDINEIATDYMATTLTTLDVADAMKDSKNPHLIFAKIIENNCAPDGGTALKIIINLLKEERFKRYRIEFENYLINRMTVVNEEGNNITSLTKPEIEKKILIFTNFISFFKMAIEAGIDPNAAVSFDGRDFSYLNMAAVVGFPDLCEFLISVNANLEAACKFSVEDQTNFNFINEGTALFYAVAINSAEITAIILKAKGNFNHVTADNLTALSIAITRGCTRALAELLTNKETRYKIHLGKQGREQKTALELAIRYGDSEAISLVKAAIERQTKNTIFQFLWKLNNKKFDLKIQNCTNFLDVLCELRTEIIDGQLQFTPQNLKKVATRAKPIPNLPAVIIVNSEFVKTILASKEVVTVYTIDKYLKSIYLKVETPVVVPKISLPVAVEEREQIIVASVSIPIPQANSNVPRAKYQKPVVVEHKVPKAIKHLSRLNHQVVKPVLTIDEVILNKLTTFTATLPNIDILILREKLETDLSQYNIDDLKKLDAKTVTKILELTFPFGLSRFMQNLVAARTVNLRGLLAYDLYMQKLKKTHLQRIESCRDTFEPMAVLYETCLPFCLQIQSSIFVEVICQYIKDNNIEPEVLLSEFFILRFYEYPELFSQALLGIKNLLNPVYLAELKLQLCRIAFQVGSAEYLDFFEAVLKVPGIIDVNEIHDDGCGLKATLLHICVMNDNEAAYFRLMNYNPNLEIPCELPPDIKQFAVENGSTALMIAARRGNLILLADLIARKANVNAVSNVKETALQIIIAYGWCESIPLLIANGADIDSMRGNFYRLTAWELATTLLLSEARTLLHKELQNRHAAWGTDTGWGNRLTLFNSHNAIPVAHEQSPEIDESDLQFDVTDLLGIGNNSLSELEKSMSESTFLFGSAPPEDTLFPTISTTKQSI